MKESLSILIIIDIIVYITEVILEGEVFLKKKFVEKYTYLIIGNSAAGISALNKLWQLDPAGSVLCISDEQERPYNKCFLADYLSGEKKEGQIFTKIFHPNVDFLFEKKVIAIDRERKTVKLSDNSEVQYGKLLLATGSSPFIPPIAGMDAVGVFTFHTLCDTNQILSYIKQSDFSHVTIIGAGLSGLEAADALCSQNLDVTVIERSAHVLSNQIEKEAASFIQERMQQQGISFMPNQEVTEILSSHGKVNGVMLSNGLYIPTHTVICATGLKPNSELAQSADIRLIGNSVWVDKYMRTSDEHIYAAGDVVVVKDQLTHELVRSSTWPDAMHQGLIAAHAMSDNAKAYPGVVTVISSAFFGVKFAACGYLPQFHKGEGYTIVSCKGNADEYCKMFIKDGVPAGFIMMGTTLPQLGTLRRSVLLKQPYATRPYRMTRNV